ncbi:hypothetical protein FGO68_gene5357 [Halteria grandinella]|uniref:Uncharacterized protein n=1 Tax=Halteria grandinella TaxID=5974 RepID=A0A8J8SUH7_HALGN|nr:hypothetical protein FGO68_gene5357 [Halteria grandinella]
MELANVVAMLVVIRLDVTRDIIQSVIQMTLAIKDLSITYYNLSACQQLPTGCASLGWDSTQSVVCTSCAAGYLMVGNILVLQQVKYVCQVIIASP